MFRLFLVAVLGVALQSHSISAQGCNCAKNYRPVCGTDEKTYGNKCELECAQKANQYLRVKFEGVCAVPYQPGKGGSQNFNQVQGSESRYNPNYIQPPRDFNFKTTTRPYYPATTYRPNTNNYYQQSNQKYTQTGQQTYNPRPNQGFQPPRQTYYQPKQPYYTTVRSTQKYYQPKQPFYPTPRPYYPTPTQKLTYTTIPPKTYYPQTYTTRPTQTYYPPTKQTYNTTPSPWGQTYYQERPTTKPYQSASQGSQSWAPAFGGGGFQDA